LIYEFNLKGGIKVSYLDKESTCQPAKQRGFTFSVAVGVICFLAGWPLLPPQAARADTTPKDIQVILKSIGFLTSKPTGNVNVAVVFEPASPESKKDADSIKALLDAAGGGPIVPVTKLVGVDQAAGLDSQAVVMSVGVSPAGQDSLAAAVKGKKVLTISTDPACARAGKCVISVHTEPSVEILFNAAAAQAAGVDFQPNFRMMITQL
jgi:hypothetical protein